MGNDIQLRRLAASLFIKAYKQLVQKEIEKGVLL
jgi:hypothetical protein